MTDARSLSPAGAALIHKWEGCGKKRADGRFDAYPDPGSKDGKPWTIGWGSTGPDIARGTIWTQAQCDARFDRDIARFVNEVAKAIGSAPTTQAQFDALVSFHYNTGAIASATLTRMHVAGRFEDAADQFARWIYNDGKPLEGLKSRRADEAALYASTVPVAAKQPMPIARADVRVVNARSGLNVRSRASASSDKLGLLARGAPVTVLQDTGEWVRIMYQGRQGWVNDQYLTAA
ncbi:glycoside hydrolase family protein [uncultured Novosphingobium sp.]|uniref:glycoside hydrolase family protein n=1 Tax=uncultured Novosphingobium sp. TaxID=292277 RepID=UPI00259A26EF|nr:glycoside hydrolase family protein [uncultured Novosphingobium sp.]